MIINLPEKEPFVIGIYSGSSEPSSVAEFLNSFVEEMKSLENFCLCVDNKRYSLQLGAIIFDAPARAFMKCVKRYSGYNSCERCTQEGLYLSGKVTFPDFNSPPRTDEDFNNMTSEDHHTGITPLRQLTVGCVSQFPLDYKHLVCLGVVRRIILLWVKGPLSCRIPMATVKDISSDLIFMRKHFPKDFCRKPRSLLEVMHWKATEFRHFMLYTGPVALFGKVKSHVCRNFLMLSVLLSPSFSEQYCDYAEKLLSVFVKNFATIYGSCFFGLQCTWAASLGR